MIRIVDYGVGNTEAFMTLFKHLGIKAERAYTPKCLDGASRLILPGVGHFDHAMQRLNDSGLRPKLERLVLEMKVPVMGVCVGMQMLAEGSEENGWHEGLNWIPGKVKKLDLQHSLSVPQVGWNNVTFNNPNPLFSRTSENPNFYFDHSYHFETLSDYRIAWCEYGIQVTAAVQKENIFGVQFHPEKSQTNGLKLFRGFFNAI